MTTSRTLVTASLAALTLGALLPAGIAPPAHAQEATATGSEGSADDRWTPTLSMRYLGVSGVAISPDGSRLPTWFASL